MKKKKILLLAMVVWVVQLLVSWIPCLPTIIQVCASVDPLIVQLLVMVFVTIMACSNRRSSMVIKYGSSSFLHLQVEHPDYWLTYGNPWEIQRKDIKYPVRFYGHVKEIPSGDKVKV